MTSQAASVRPRAALPLSRKDRAIDGGIALVAFGLTLLLLASGAGGASRSLDPLGAVLAALASLPLLFRRRWPLGVLVLTTAASALLNGLDYPNGPPVGATVALFFVGADERTPSRIRETGAVVIGLFALHVGSAGIHHGFPLTPLLFGILVWGSAFVVGDRVRQRRQRTAELEERARRAERESERERRLAAAEERTRIARDLHDSAGHAINVILVQAGAARLLQERDPEAARAALQTIEDVARETIGEIDQLVRVLREEGANDGAADAIEPPAGLAALATIAARHRAAGLAVDVSVRGASRPLAPAVDQAAYRILQEALTNAARHGLGSADVDVAFDESTVELTVTNATRPDSPAGNGGGHGLVGMRERAALLGGSLETGQGDGVFRVRARLPYGGEDE